jgi:hypothetical protein
MASLFVVICGDLKENILRYKKSGKRIIDITGIENTMTVKGVFEYKSRQLIKVYR